MSDAKLGDIWAEEDSRAFTDYGDYFVPRREEQIDTICRLIPTTSEPQHIVELCCGAGMLARALLERFPTTRVHGFDASPEMLATARRALHSFEHRVSLSAFRLEDASWRTFPYRVDAFVTSLAVHHLDPSEKRTLFTDCYRALVPGGRLIIADVVRPASPEGSALAAYAWDETVRQRALAIDGSLDAFLVFQRDRWNYHGDANPDPIDKPDTLVDQLTWLREAGFREIDVYWMLAGHAVFGGTTPNQPDQG